MSLTRGVTHDRTSVRIPLELDVGHERHIAVIREQLQGVHFNCTEQCQPTLETGFGLSPLFALYKIMDLQFDDIEELRKVFESQSNDSFKFRRSRKGNYVNPPISRDWKWFQLGVKAARDAEKKKSQP